MHMEKTLFGVMYPEGGREEAVTMLASNFDEEIPVHLYVCYVFIWGQSPQLYRCQR